MRLRITFSKSGSLRYTGHLDLHTIWERTIRRAGLPLMYTQGFHPGPKIQLASALPLGFIGRAEIVDLWLEDIPAPGDKSSNDLNCYYTQTIQPAAPPGLTILSVEPVEEPAPALQTQVVSAEYEVTLLDPPDASALPDLPQRLATLLASASLPSQRRGKNYDLRPLIEGLSLLPPDAAGPHRLWMCLAARESATGRPEAVLEALGIPLESTRIERIRIILKDGNK
jgi:radical SAM-linked protein